MVPAVHMVHVQCVQFLTVIMDSGVAQRAHKCMVGSCLDPGTRQRHWGKLEKPVVSLISK